MGEQMNILSSNLMLKARKMCRREDLNKFDKDQSSAKLSLGKILNYKLLSDAFIGGINVCEDFRYRKIAWRDWANEACMKYSRTVEKQYKGTSLFTIGTP